jgi:von Willebrand factor type A domain
VSSVRLPAIPRGLRLAAALLLVLWALPAGTAPVFARPAAAQPAGEVELLDILQALEVATVAADVVVLLDTSQSMQAAGLYAGVTAALRPLLDALSPTDRLILFTFDTVPALRYAGAAGPRSLTAVARLPRHPNGRFTDTGAAIDAGIRELESPGASSLGAIVLITDGRAHPPDGSIYRDTSGPAWSALRRRTAALAARGHQVNAHGLALQADTDAALLKRVFPAATVLALPPDQLGPFMRRLRERLRLDKAKELLAGDRDASVQVRWPARQLEQLDLSRGVADVEIELVSTARRLPLELSGVTAVSSGGLDLQVSGLPDHVRLDPGERRRVAAQVRFPTVGGFRIGRRTVERHGSVRLQADVASPWGEVVHQQLGLDLRPSLQGGVGQVRATGSAGLSRALITLAVGMLVLVIVAARSAVLARRPRLRGTLVARAPGTPPQQVKLTGRTLRIGRRRGSRLEIAGAGSVRARRSGDRRRARRSRGIELLISYSAGRGRRQSSSCPANGSVVVDGTTFTYHAS